MQTFAYVFLSQDSSHDVPEALQMKAIEDYGRGLQIPSPEIVVEKRVSMKKPLVERPEGAKLLKACRQGDCIIVMKASWVLTSAADGIKLLARLREMQVALHCIDLGGNISLPEKRRLVVSEGPSVIVEKVLSALNSSEDCGHGQAIRLAKRHKREQGKYLGGPVPFGWQVGPDGCLVPNPNQQQVIAAIINMRKDRWSYREIAGKLRTELNVELSHEGVRKLVKNSAALID
jgi:putative DNA-invertase from lambdoid prophage Rac